MKQPKAAVKRAKRSAAKKSGGGRAGKGGAGGTGGAKASGPAGSGVKAGGSGKGAPAHAQHKPLHHAHKPSHHTALHHTHHAKAKAPKKRGLALGGGVAWCAAEALAASLRGSECPVTLSEVLDLYAHTADGPDAGASISETLEAAYVYGLAGVRPVSFEPVDMDDPAASVLGLELPGPHTVLATPQGWVSWGACYCPCEFPDAVIEEAWRVEWPTTA